MAIHLARSNLPENHQRFSNRDISKLLSNHAPEELPALLALLADLRLGPEIWSADLGPQVALIGGKSKQNSLPVILRAGSYSISSTTRAAVVFAGESLLSLSPNLLPIVDFRGFYPTPSHLPLAVWLLTTARSYTRNVEKILVFGTGYWLSTLWVALKAMVPSAAEMIEFVDEKSIWEWIEKDGFVVRPLQAILKERVNEAADGETAEQTPICSNDDID